VLLLVNHFVVCDEEFFSFLCGHSVLEFPRVDVCKAKKLSHLFVIIVGYKPKMFTSSHILCKPFVVKAGVKVPSFAIKDIVIGDSPDISDKMNSITPTMPKTIGNPTIIPKTIHPTHMHCLS
jgi:hypothetical protein